MTVITVQKDNVLGVVEEALRQPLKKLCIQWVTPELIQVVITPLGGDTSPPHADAPNTDDVDTAEIKKPRPEEDG